MDFDTRKDSAKDRTGRGFRPLFGPSATQNASSETTGSKDVTFTITPGSRKTALVNLALEAWREGEIDPKDLGQVRGRDVDEAGFRRALYRSSIYEIEYHLGPILKGRRVIVEGRLPGAGRYALIRLGAEVEEQRPKNEERYVDMTPVIFVFVALVMAARVVSLGLDDQTLYILSGIAFAVLYGLRPFISKLQRPKTIEVARRQTRPLHVGAANAAASPRAEKNSSMCPTRSNPVLAALEAPYRRSHPLP